MSVSPSLWLDAAPATSRRAALQESARQAAAGMPSWVLGTVVATSADDTSLPAGWVRVAIPADSPTSEATGMSDGGLSAVGATVRVTLDATGRVTGISSPITIPDGANTVATGSLGERISAAMSQAAEAYSQAAAIRESAQQAAAAAERAMTDAAAAIKAAEEATGAVVSAAEPVAPVEGQIWYVLDPYSGETIVAVKVRVGDEWVARPLVAEQVLVPGSVGTVALQDGAVTAPKVHASEELWAKIGAFASVTTDMLTAGGATITGSAVVGDLTGNTLRGGLVVAGDGTNGTVQAGDTDTGFGLSLTTPSAGSAQMSAKATGPYIIFRDKDGNETFYADGTGNLRMKDRVRGGTVSLDNYLASWTFNKDMGTGGKWELGIRTTEYVNQAWEFFNETQGRVMSPTGKLRLEHQLSWGSFTDLAGSCMIQLGLYTANPTSPTRDLYGSIAYAHLFDAVSSFITPATGVEIVNVQANTWYYVRAIWKRYISRRGTFNAPRYWSQITPV